MRRDFLKLAAAGAAGVMTASLAPAMQAQPEQSASGIPRAWLDARQYGAAGNCRTLDTAAINRAIAAAAAAGGGTVMLPAGQYLCYSIHLRNNVALFLDQGAAIIAADALPEGQPGGYDEPEAEQPWEAYQDLGHNHWHNSLLWGEGLENVTIRGPGRIWGRGLSRDNGPHTRNPADRRTSGVGNKSISLKDCRNVQLRDFQILQGRWFGTLATGVDNLAIDGLTIDTNRDGMDIDYCRNVRVSNCAVTSPWDDGIVPKSSYALGYARATENLAIVNCYVTGAHTNWAPCWTERGSGSTRRRGCRVPDASSSGL
jgi:polygalacturonase